MYEQNRPSFSKNSLDRNSEENVPHRRPRPPPNGGGGQGERERGGGGEGERNTVQTLFYCSLTAKCCSLIQDSWDSLFSDLGCCPAETLLELARRGSGGGEESEDEAVAIVEAKEEEEENTGGKKEER